VAESLIALTEGSGKSLHTFQRSIGGNTVEDQAVILGEQYLATYECNFGVSGAATTATAASHIFQVMAGASLKVRVRRIRLYQFAMATTVTVAQVNVMRLTSAGTGGGVNTLAPLDSTDAAAGATFMQLPTAKGSEGTTIWIGGVSMMQTLGASTAPMPPILDLNWDSLHSKPPIIPAGATNGICLKWVTAVAAGTVWADVLIDEGNF
jgi:hypothetical protein